MLEFDKCFFHDEVREGFYVSSKMKRCWAVMLEMIDTISDICRRNEIQIFADYGTLLGAVRHGGFIPWDDDADMCVKRADLKRFADALRNEMPDGWMLLECDSQNQNYFNPWYRIINHHSVLLKNNEIERYYGYRYSAGIDVFILDHMPSNEDEIEILKVLNDIMFQICYPKGATDEEFEERIKAVEELLNVKIERNGRKYEKSAVMRLLQTIMSMYTKNDSDLYTKCCVTYYGKRRFKTEWFDDVKYLPFENILVPVPGEYKKVVTEIYGDYTVRKRGGGAHKYPSFKTNERKFFEGYKKKTGIDLRYNPDRLTILDNAGRPEEKKNGKTFVFLPHSPDVWRYVDSIWKSIKENQNNRVYVVPIPCFEKDCFGKLTGQIMDEAQYPDYLEILRPDDVDIDKLDIDVIVIQQPFDDRNEAIGVAPAFYSSELRKRCRQLILVPGFEIAEFESREDICFSTFEYFAAMPGVVWADRVIVQSNNIRNMYVEYLSEWAGEDTRNLWMNKIIAKEIDAE